MKLLHPDVGCLERDVVSEVHLEVVGDVCLVSALVVVALVDEVGDGLGDQGQHDDVAEREAEEEASGCSCTLVTFIRAHLTLL